ncbi:hypothetical protein ARMGADRAFT_437276 [Armillaria gallica]|uniref:Uncharacterized protein n=1 Tax=Armillaria gallica TaxID=47427 RepID=A0A2H3CY15_ARMGA|nr:hypothetical protein ARMGADRAFT_437276 [Armillaria gallica]
MLLEVREELPTDVILGFDWFASFAEQACDLEYSSSLHTQLYRLVDMYKSICRPSSRLFIPSAPDDTVVDGMFGHGLVVGTTCTDHSDFRARIVQHLLAGLCAGGGGPHCTDVVQVCRSAFVYPHVFFVACVASSSIVERCDAHVLPPFSAFFAPSVGRNKRRAAQIGVNHRLQRLRYMPYLDERSYLLQVVNVDFERMHLAPLTAITRAHRIECSGGERVGWYRNAVAEHLLLGHCLSWVDSPIPNVPVRCLDFLAEFYFTRGSHN